MALVNSTFQAQPAHLAPNLKLIQYLLLGRFDKALRSATIAP